jgi:hypothetical protein
VSFVAAFAYLAPAAICFAACAFVYRRGGPSWARAVGTATPAALITAGVWAVLRGADFLAGWGGPLSWVRVTRDVGTDEGPLVQVVLRLGLFSGLVFGVALIVVARWSKGGRRLPVAVAAAAAASLGAVLIGVAFASGPLPFGAAVPLDFAGMVPMIAVGFGVGFLRRPLPAAGLGESEDGDAAELAGPAEASSADSSTYVDAEKVLSASKFVTGRPSFSVAADPASAVGQPSPSDRVWHACGGIGPTPTAVVQADERVGAPGGLLVGDLAAPTAAAVIDAVSILTLLARAGRVLVVARDPRGVRDRIAAHLDELGAVVPGAMTAGEGELRDALARNTMPALVCLDLGHLAGESLRAQTPGKMSWTSMLDLVILGHVDSLHPIEATHMAFTLRRLGLTLEANRNRPSWFAVGGTGPGSVRYLEQATFERFDTIALGANARVGLRVHVKALDATDAAASEINAAAEALRARSVDVHCEDAVGDLRVKLWPGYNGACSLALLEDRQLAGLFRARTNLAHTVESPNGHVARWWVYDSPLASFLLRDDNLVGLEEQDELPAPRPVYGLGNQFLAAAHIEAALYEGRPDEQRLRRAFGDRAFEDLLRVREADLRHDGHRSRYDTDSHKVERSAIVTAPGEQWPDPRRETITANVIDVLNTHGALLRRIDQRVAATRYYPHRVFRAGGALYQVPSESLESGARSLRVASAVAGAVPTDPELTTAIDSAEWVGTPKQHQVGGMSFARGVAKVVVTESVGGAIRRGADTAAVRFPAVTASYSTLAVVVMFSKAPAKALYHAGRSAGQVLPAHLLVDHEDVDVVALPGGLAGVNRPSLVFVDRHVGGIGVADALDAPTLHGVLFWSRNVLSKCSCLRGCDECTPAEVLAAGPDKVQAIKLLGAR